MLKTILSNLDEMNQNIAAVQFLIKNSDPSKMDQRNYVVFYAAIMKKPPKNYQKLSLVFGWTMRQNLKIRTALV